MLWAAARTVSAAASVATFRLAGATNATLGGRMSAIRTCVVTPAAASARSTLPVSSRRLMTAG